MELIAVVLVPIVLGIAATALQAGLAERRWTLEAVHGAVVGDGAFRSAPQRETRARWLGIRPTAFVAALATLLWAFATVLCALAGLLLPPVWPVAISGFVLAVRLVGAAFLLAARDARAPATIGRVALHSYLHHAAVLLTFVVLAAIAHDMVGVLLFTLAACGIGVGVTLLLTSAARLEADVSDVSGDDAEP